MYPLRAAEKGISAAKLQLSVEKIATKYKKYGQFLTFYKKLPKICQQLYKTCAIIVEKRTIYPFFPYPSGRCGDLRT